MKKSFLSEVSEFPFVVAAVFILGLFYLNVSCANAPPAKAPEVYPTFPTFPSLYVWSKYTPPQAAPSASVTLTAITVNPESKNLLISGATSPDLNKLYNSFASSLGSDFESLLVAKGMTVKGPYGTLSEVTYPDKETSDLIVYAYLVFDINDTTREQGGDKYKDVYYRGNNQTVLVRERDGNMYVDIKVYYTMLEPLSGEKMWVKKLDLTAQEISYRLAYGYDYQSYQEYYNDGCTQGYRTNYKYVETNKIAFDTRAHEVSKVLKNEYQHIMEAAWTYFSTDEMMELKKRAKDIRARKRY